MKKTTTRKSAALTYKIRPEVLNAWKEVLLKVAKPPEGYSLKRNSPEEVVDAIVKKDRKLAADLWKVFNTERHEIGRYLLNTPKETLAYLLGFHLSNIARMQACLHRAHSRTGFMDQLDKFEKIEVFDIGCGTGSMSIALADSVHRKIGTSKFHFDLSDQKKLFFQMAADGMSALKFDCEVRAGRSKADEMLARISERKYEKDTCVVLCFGYLFNEIMNDRKSLQAVSRTIQNLTDRGIPCITIITDSAHERISKFLMSIRNDLVTLGQKPIYPCPHQQQCPMMEEGRDWCYSEMEWQIPKQQQIIDRSIDIKRTRMGVSAYILANKHFDSKSVAENTKIIVGRPTKARSPKNKTKTFQYLFCGEKGNLSKTRDLPAHIPHQMRGAVYRKPLKEVKADAEKAAEDEPVGKKPAFKKPTGKVPAFKKPASKKPAGKNPAFKKPSSKKPAGKKPAFKKPARKKQR